MPMKGKHILPVWGLCVLLSLAGCRPHAERAPEELLRIDTLCEYDPARAMLELDSLSVKYEKEEGEAFYKYRLLCIKAKDKAYIPIGGEKQVKEIVRHYKSQGDGRDLLESYYYLGGYYRDNNDYPRAVESYGKALQVAGRSEGCAESFPAACCYAQLSGIYMRLSQLDKMLSCAKREHEIYSALNPRDIVKEQDLARAYRICGKNDSASIYYARSLSLIRQQGTEGNHGPLAEVLFFYTMTGKRAEAVACASLLGSEDTGGEPANVWGALGEYHRRFGNADSARHYMLLQYEHPRNWTDRRNCAHDLFEYYKARGDWKTAVEYATAYDEACDSTEVAGRREAARDADNFFRYTESLVKDMELQREMFRDRILLALALLACTVLLGVLLAARRIYSRRMRTARNEIDMQRKRLEEGTADVVSLHERFREAVGEKSVLKQPGIWDELVATIDVSYPAFGDALRARKDVLEADDVKLVCLLKLGLRKKEVGSLLGVSPSSVTRRLHVFEDKMGCKWTDL